MNKEIQIKDISAPEDFADLLRRHGMELPIRSDLSLLGQPLTVGGKTIPNRICIQPLEGFDSRDDGSPHSSRRADTAASRAAARGLSGSNPLPSPKTERATRTR